MKTQFGVFLVAIQLMSCLPVFGLQNSSDSNSATQTPVSQRDIDLLRRRIEDEGRSNIEIISQYRTETGDLNNRLDYLRYGVRANFVWRPGSALYIGATQTPYRTTAGFLTEWGTNVTGGFRGQASENVTINAELGITQFSTDTATINGLASIQVRVSEQWSAGVTISRSNVEETLMSAAGIQPPTGPFAGELVGRVMDNRLTVDVRHQPIPKLELFGKGGFGRREGSNVGSNFFGHLDGGAAYNIISRTEDELLTLLRASYIAQYYGFADDRSGFGGASLQSSRDTPLPIANIGSDGISPNPSEGRPGVGGYFSPPHYINAVLRADIRGQLSPEVTYEGAGFIGSQSFTDSPRHRAGGFSGTVAFRLNDRYSLPITFAQDNFGPFTTQSFMARLIIRL